MIWKKLICNDLKSVWHGNTTVNYNYIVVEDIHDNLRTMHDKTKVMKYYRELKKKNADITPLDYSIREYI